MQPMEWSKYIVCQAKNGKKKKLSCHAKSIRKDIGAGYETFFENIRLFEEAGCEDLPEWIKSEVKDAETLAINEGRWHSTFFSRFPEQKLIALCRNRENANLMPLIKHSRGSTHQIAMIPVVSLKVQHRPLESLGETVLLHMLARKDLYWRQ
ncbi:hypothetical protein ElyMa_004100700 [Elysia marginata]|uniref:Uncharacterized protein n=1 Tax=Elysia marginata TaxID=1093978 RepID=A0AAV4GBN7_9GAST|nr:hypothetical protein ElyMa_004100700 [Elysia marginata]